MDNKVVLNNDSLKSSANNNNTDMFSKGRQLSIMNLIKNNEVEEIKSGSRKNQESFECHHNYKKPKNSVSGPLLLTVANLERFMAVHNNTSLHEFKLTQLKKQNELQVYNPNVAETCLRIFDFDINRSNMATPINQKQIEAIIPKNPNADTVLEISSNLIQMKDLVDTMSTVSSTHFTMVNGGVQEKKIRRGVCSGVNKITVLLLIMSGILLFGIIFLVYLVESNHLPFKY